MAEDGRSPVTSQAAAFEYLLDAGQRWILFLDVLRQRGNAHLEHQAQTVPHVLSFEGELVLDGRTLPRPVNYGLIRIVPPEGVVVDQKKRPFIVVDPRAGHGPGIGGMKHDSEIGVALQAGHPCYFIGFLPAPMPGQTILDVCHAEAAFVERVQALHPDADGKPCLIGNCQAGWQVMMMAALYPERVGPILLAGSPLSYWAGVHGKNPLRYTGGMLGGTWLTALAGDLGHGIFDGAALVQNFESLNPANTFWKKNYNVFSRVDTEPPRFLEFEKWWGSPVLLNAEEMQYIADNLFVGNRLTAGEMKAEDGTVIDLRRIRSPIIVFCSEGDDITPPPQALGWITDLYPTDEALVAGGQTIVYSRHQSIGHLGIFVSGKIAKKEHEEFAQNMDLIDTLPPGLYEAVIGEKRADDPYAHLVLGDYVVRFETRRLDDIRTIVATDPADDRRFATVARLSEVNRNLYQATMGPLLRAMIGEDTAETLRRLNPHRVRFEMFSDRNPWMQGIAQLAEMVRADRRPAALDNPFLIAQQQMATRIEQALEQAGKARDDATEALFQAIYGPGPLQALLGIDADSPARPSLADDPAEQARVRAAVRALRQRMAEGGLRAATVRALVYLAQAGGGADERSFMVIREFQQRHPELSDLTLVRYKELLKEQFLLLHLDQEAALASLPAMMPEDRRVRAAALDLVRRCVHVRGTPHPAVLERLKRIEAIFDVGEVEAPAEPAETTAAETSPVETAPAEPAAVTATEPKAGKRPPAARRPPGTPAPRRQRSRQS